MPALTILGHNPPHDSALSMLRDRRLVFSCEAEKDSYPRHTAAFGWPRLLATMGGWTEVPEVLAFAGLGEADGDGFIGPYIGTAASVPVIERACVFGRLVDVVHTSHERAHILGGYGMSPFPQGQPCHVLVWEGSLGNFYRVDETVGIQPLGTALSHPGLRYSAPFTLATSAGCGVEELWRLDSAGKMMALAGCAGAALGDWRPEVARFLDHPHLLARHSIEQVLERWKRFPLAGQGADTPRFIAFARALSDAIYDVFHRYATTKLEPGLPLIVVGGCALNCDWNRRWRECGWFSEVFVPPCPNDSGVAIGAAIDAQFTLTGDAKIEWDVYAGAPFDMDDADLDGFRRDPLAYDGVAGALAQGAVIAWVQGRYEMGPRALGNRSLLASPLRSEIRDRLNRIKARERYRPVAPVCTASAAGDWFETPGPSPHMLYLAEVRDARLEAVRHEDGSARLQTVDAAQNPQLHELLNAFAGRTGVPVLCNTSLNTPGRGFINRLSDLVRFARERDLDGFVVDDAWFQRERSATVVDGQASSRRQQ